MKSEIEFTLTPHQMSISELMQEAFMNFLPLYVVDCDDFASD